MKTFRRNLIMGFLLIFAALGIFFGCAPSNKVTIKFETNGGAAIESATVTKGETYSLPTPVYDEAHEFDGWYDNAELTGSKVTSVVAESNVTFYAKWTELSKVTLENGGNLPQTLYLKAGANVYEFMKDRVPVLDGDHQFAAWYVGEKELSRSTTMPAEGITLTAHYKVKYIGHAFVQSVDGASYEAGEDYTGFGFEGELPAFEREGFTLNLEHEGADALRPLSVNASENVFRIYFDRKQASVLLFANYPGESSSEAERLSYPFGATVKLPTDLFTRNGYCLTGWSTSVSGEAEYDSAYLYDRLFNKEGVEAPEEFTVDGETVTLYAVWTQGYVDMFGGSDIVYHFVEHSEEGDQHDLYIYRNGVFFKGIYRAEGADADFYLRLPSGTFAMRGKFGPDNTYSYYDETRVGTYDLYENRELNTNVRLTVDGYNGVELRQPGEDGHVDTSVGTYVISSTETFSGYVATFTSGPLSGQTLNLLVGYIESGAGRRNAFQVQNLEDVALGTLYRFVDPDHLYPSVYQVSLNGFGVATMNMGSSNSSFYYSREDDVISLFNANDELVFELHLIQSNNRNGYYLYQSELDHVFESADGAQLELDGFYSAVYREGGSETQGNYLIYSTRLNGYIVEFTAGSVTRRFRISITETENEEGAEPTYTYTLENLTDAYQEFLYSNGSSVYYIPLLVLDDGAAGKASLYGYPGAQVYTKFADGSYSYDGDTGLYLFTLENFYEVENMTTGFGTDIDVSLLQSFVFGTVSTDYEVYYLYSFTLRDQLPTQYSSVYSKGEDTLTLVASFGFYKTADGVRTGTYSRLQNMQNILQFTPTDGGDTVYFELNEEGKTFEILSDFLGTVYGTNAAGSAVRTVYLEFDGKGGAVYHDTTADLTLEGTYETAESKTLLGNDFYRFLSPDGENDFSFMLYSTGNSVVFVRYNETLAGRYHSELGEGLVLDGFAGAEYTYNGQTVSGIYSYLEEENIIRLNVSAGQSTATFYIDLRGEGIFSVRGPEYTSTCLWYDNQTRQDVYFALDGYGKLTAYDREGNPIDENGSYEELGDGRYLFTYTDGTGKKVPIYGALGTASVGGLTYLALIVEHDGVAGTYINEEDYTVLNLDAYGSAVHYDNMGAAESGRYLLVTGNMLYYFTDSDACIYTYDTARGVATPAKFTTYGYYTQNLEALNFSEYGYVYIEGERCYFRVERDTNNVIIYRAPREGETVNEYGFVEDRSFGTFTAEKEYNGKTYYRSDGYNITFVRAEENAGKYPILTGTDVYTPLGNLSFGPSGDGRFSVSGRVEIGDLNKNNSSDNCTVVRNILEDGTTELYLRLDANLGYYRFDLSIEYHGDAAGRGVNLYSITGMRYIVELPSYNYLYMNYLYNMLSGGLLGIQNVFGTLTVTKICGEDGVISENGTIDLQFGSALPIADYEGNLISLDGVSDFEEISNGAYNYEVRFTSADTYTYVFRLARRAFTYTRSYGFSVYSLTRLQSFDVTVDGEAGKLEVERVIFSELSGVQAGDIGEVRLYRGETLLESEDYSDTFPDGKYRYIVCEHADDEANTITSTTFYNITFTEKIPEEVEDTQNTVQPYTAASVESEQMTTKYTADGNGFAHLDGNGKIVLFILGRTYYIVQDCTYSEESGTYDLTTISGRTFRVTTDEDGKLTFTEVTSPAA